MGDLAPGFRGGRPRGWLSACILGMMMFMTAVRFVDAEASYSNYAANVCYCDLNNHLQNVRSALLTGKDPPEIPSDDSTAVTDSSNSSGTSGTSGGNSNIDSSSSAGSNTDSSTASDTSSNSGTNTDTNTQSDSSDSGSTSSSSGSNASGDSSGTTASGDSSGTTASGDSSGTTASGDSSGTTASGDSSGTADSSDSSGTTASSNSSGTAESGDSSGTTASGDSSGTTVSGNSSGTTVSGDSSGTTVSGDSSGTKASNDSSGTTDSGDSSGTTASVDSSGTTASNDSSETTDSGSTNGNATTTTAEPNNRRKRDVDEEDYYGKEVETLMETPLEEVLESYYGPRMKREAAPGAPLVDQTNPLFSFITQKVEYEGIKFSSDYGVEYDEEGNIKNCTCETGSSVELSICLLNLEYTSDLKDSASEKHQLVSNRLLFPMSVILNKGLIAAGGVNLFRRLDIKSFRKEKDYTTAVLQAHLREKLYQAEYHVKNAIEPSIRHGEIGPYTTDHEECFVTVDQTPVEPEELPALWYLRFLCLPIAILVLVAIVAVICVGKRDACNVLKW